MLDPQRKPKAPRYSNMHDVEKGYPNKSKLKRMKIDENPNTSQPPPLHDPSSVILGLVSLIIALAGIAGLIIGAIALSKILALEGEKSTLVGPKGTIGETGEIGPQGLKGDVGQTGPMGQPGVNASAPLNGINGTNGIGYNGTNGANGIGYNGTNGIDGANGLVFSFFGSGRDGSVVISVNTTLTKDMYYQNLTINAGISLNTAMFKIFVKGYLNTGSGAVIIVPPANGANATAGVGVYTGTLGSMKSGSAGSQSSNPAVGGASSNVPKQSGSLEFKGGKGGRGGEVSVDGALGGTITTCPVSAGQDSELILFPNSNKVRDLSSTVYTAGSGGGGGSGFVDTNASGGGGGSGGGIILIFAYKVITSGILTISAHGGNGGNSSVDNGSGNGGGSGAGGGGGGGLIIWASTTDLSSNGQITFNVTGGAAGIPDDNPTWCSNCTHGVAGTVGLIYGTVVV